MRYLSRVPIIKALKGKWLPSVLLFAFSSQALANPCPPSCEMHEVAQEQVESSIQVETATHSDCHGKAADKDDTSENSNPCSTGCMNLSRLDLNKVSSTAQFEIEKYGIVNWLHARDADLVANAGSIIEPSPPPGSSIPVYLATHRLRI